MIKLRILRGGIYLGLTRWMLHAVPHIPVTEGQRESGDRHTEEKGV